MYPHASNCLVLVAFLCTALLMCRANERFIQLYNEKNEALKDVSSQLINTLEQSARCDAAKSCNDGDCLPNGCSDNSFGREYQCSSLLQTVGQSNFCSDSCRPRDRLLSLRSSSLTTPPNTLRYRKEGSVQHIEVEDLELRRDVCAFKRIQPSLGAAFRKHNLQSWLYVSSSTGLMMTYPSTAQNRTEPNLRQCGFIPTRRPWYIAAASGSKDVVFIFDRTSLTTAEKVSREALENELKSLQRDDYVAVITVSGDKTEVLPSSDSPSTLRQADDKFKEALGQAVSRLEPSNGYPVMKQAIEKAFDILQESAKQRQTSSCSKIIVILAGRAPACFQECDAAGECTCTDELVKALRAKQNGMGDSKVSIVAFTEGNDNDLQRVARSLVCESAVASAWHQVTANETADSALAAYSDIAGLTQKSKEYTSDIYEDGFGLGRMITIAKPVYEKDTDALVGVSGVDITITEVADRVGGMEAAVAAIEDQIRQERRGCNPREPDSCSKQRLRRRYGEICADVLVRANQPWKCYRAGDSLFVRSEAVESWGEARTRCKGLGSGADLAVVDNEGKNELIAGISDYDGAWIGLRAGQGNELGWISGSSFEKEDFSFNFDYQEEIANLHGSEVIDACVSVDRRGTSGNWNIVPCDAKRMAICEVKMGAENVSSICAQDVIFDKRTTQYDAVHNVDCESSDRQCPVEGDGALKKANPLCAEGDGSGKSEFDRRCCGGRSDQGDTQCEESEGSSSSSSSSSSGAVIGGAVGGAVGTALVVLLLVLFLRKKKNAKGSGDSAPPALSSEPPSPSGDSGDGLPFPQTEHSVTPGGGGDEFKCSNDRYDSLDI